MFSIFKHINESMLFEISMYYEAQSHCNDILILLNIHRRVGDILKVSD